MATKLKPLLHKLISPNQTGFLHNRSILHGFHYAQQVMHATTKQGIQIAAFKADIYKAFDTLHWRFLLDSLAARGFPLNWINCIQNRVLMGTSRIIINSVAGKHITLRRGVRQGDLISPYLFNLAVDFLPRWMDQLNTLNYLTPPFPNCKTCLLYANDRMLFLKPVQTQIVKVKLLFQIFRKISRLKLNLLKSELSVTSASISLTESLAQAIQCKPVAFPFKYLGLPLSDKRLTRNGYSSIIDKIQMVLSGWKAAFLSIGGRIILINAVMSAIPQYFMSGFLLPKWALRKIDQIRRRFLWHGHKEQHFKGLYIVNWTLALRLRSLGGLRIWDIGIANQALLMKWMWE